MWNMFKVNNKDTRIHKVNDKVKNKDTVDVVLASLLLTLTTFHFLLQCFYCLLFWRFVPDGINFGKVSTYEENSKMHENTWGRVTFLVNLMFRKLKNLMGSYSRGRIYGGGVGLGAYIRDVNQVTTYSLGGGGCIFGGGLIYGGVLTGFYGIRRKTFGKKSSFFITKSYKWKKLISP